jgi:hypothetical protein
MLFQYLFQQYGKVFPEKRKKYCIMCNVDGYITDVDDDTLSIILYEKENIVGKFVGVLMSPFMEKLHKHILLPKYKKMNQLQKNIVHIFLSGISIKRPLIIYTVNQTPIYITLYIHYTLNMFRLEFIVEPDLDNSNIYTHNIHIKNDYQFKESKNRLVIISLDFVNSTENLIKDGTLKFIETTQRFHTDIIHIIKTYYYPYIYIHEIVGDSFIIVLNADWTYNINKYTASLAFSFLEQLFKHTESYIKIRCGVVFDKIYYGNIDHNLRFFGETINKAARLESICSKKNELFCDDSFINKLDDEGIYNVEHMVTKEIHHLKGFGDVICHSIITNNPLFTENNIMITR